jgi:hypothetical protein
VSFMCCTLPLIHKLIHSQFHKHTARFIDKIKSLSQSFFPSPCLHLLSVQRTVAPCHVSVCLSVCVCESVFPLRSFLMSTALFPHPLLQEEQDEVSVVSSLCCKIFVIASLHGTTCDMIFAAATCLSVPLSSCQSVTLRVCVFLVVKAGSRVIASTVREETRKEK